VRGRGSEAPSKLRSAAPRASRRGSRIEGRALASPPVGAGAASPTPARPRRRRRGLADAEDDKVRATTAAGLRAIGLDDLCQLGAALAEHEGLL